MASSGNFTSNSAGASYPNPCNLYFEWWVSNWSQADNWHDVSFNLKAGGGKEGYWTYYNNITLNVDGQTWTAGRTKAYHGQVLISGTKRLYHDNAGNRSFGANASAGIYTTATNVWGNGSWNLDSIARHASLTNCSGNINDDGTPWVEFYNPANASISVWLEIIESNGTISEHIAQRNNVGSRYTWSLSAAERNTLRSKLSTTTSKTLRYVVYDNVGGVENWSTRDAKLSIVSANPTFTTFKYEDTNTKSTGLTGNNQILIQGVSALKVLVPVANKATAKKQASIRNYTATISGMSKSANYSADKDVSITGFGSNFTSGNQVLSVKATDSRGLSATASKTVQVLAYSKPVINASAVRANNFENETTLHIEGAYARLTVNKTDKNTISSVKYRYKKQSTSTWGAWTDAEELKVTSGKFTTKNKVLSLDNNSSWDMQIQVIDNLNTVTASLTVSVGIPIMRIGADGFVYNKEQPLMVSHVGQVIMSTTLNTAAKVAAIYGGTWEAWGKGRVPVGVDLNDADFNAPNKSGGAKTVTLTQAQMPSHTHKPIGNGDFVQVDSSGGQKFGFAAGDYYNLIWKTGGSTASSGSGQPHNNLQPYSTVYLWRRSS